MRRRQNSEHGNVLFLILITTALFAALSYAVTQSTRGGGDVKSDTNKMLVSRLGNNMAQIDLEYQRLRMKCGIEQIDFDENTSNAPNQNPLSPSDRSCSLWHSATTGIDYDDVQKEWHIASPSYIGWYETEHVVVKGVGSDEESQCAGCELLLKLQYLKQDICAEINNTFLGSNFIPTFAGDFGGNQWGSYSGTFPAGPWDRSSSLDDVTNVLGQTTFCIYEASEVSYTLVHVLEAR